MSLLSIVLFLSLSPASFAADVAKVNGRIISEADLRDSLVGFNDGQRAQLLKDLSTRKELVQTLIKQELFAQKGEKEGLDKTADYKQDYQQWRKQWLAKRIVETQVDPQVTTDAARNYYSDYLYQYSTDQYRVIHLLAPSLVVANELLKEAQKPNVDFQDLAEKKSTDPTAKNNRGDLGFISWDSALAPEFKTAVIKASVGKVVGPIQTAYGFHLLKVTEKRFGKRLTFDEVELQVKADMKRMLTEKLVSQLKSNAKISIQ